MGVTPVGLEKDFVDLGGVDGFGLIPDRFDHGTDAEVFGGSENAFTGAVDEVEGRFGEGGMRESDEVELGVDEFGDVIGGEGLEFGGVGDAGEDVAVDLESEGGLKFGVTEEEEVMIFGEIF